MIFSNKLKEQIKMKDIDDARIGEIQIVCRKFKEMRV